MKHAELARVVADDVDRVTLRRPGFSKHYITVNPGKDASPAFLFGKLARSLREQNATVVHQEVFGPCLLEPAGMDVLRKLLGPVEWPVTWIEGNGSASGGLTGTHVYAITGSKVRPVMADGRIVGGHFEDDTAEYCLLGDLLPVSVAATREAQTRSVFEIMEQVLHGVGMDFSHVIRTWLYLDRILEWYTEFNRVRTVFFDERGVFDGLLPASTGVGVGNPTGAALVADVLACKPKDGRVRARAVESPLQCPAPNYRSSFSRAVEMQFPDHRRLYISGTASIDPDGKTAHVGDVAKQIDLSMRVMQAILRSCGMGWTDITRAVAYLVDIKKRPLFETYCRENHIPLLPIAVAHSDICRDDLLFEIEADAVRVGSQGDD